jgi:hypothetical protein
MPRTCTNTDAFLNKANTFTGVNTFQAQVLSPSILTGLTLGTTGTASSLTYAANALVRNNFTGAAAQTVTLPAATAGTVVIHYQRVDTTGGTNTLVFDCAGSDVYRTNSLIPSGFAAAAVTYDNSTALQTKITFTPADATTNFISRGSQFKFWCVEDGIWDVELDNSQCMNNTLTAVTGAIAFSS